MSLGGRARIIGSLLKRLYIETYYLKYWLGEKGNVLFDKYSARMVRGTILLDIDPSSLTYALPWQLLRDEVVTVDKFPVPRRYRRPLDSCGWYQFALYGNYNDPTLVTIAGGHWDLEEKLGLVDQDLTVRAFHDVFERGLRWEDTDYFPYLRNYKFKGREHLVERRLTYNVELFDNIKTRGYVTQKDTESVDFEHLHPEFPRQRGDEIRIAVGRDGKLVFVDGRHRLAAARVLGCPSIPARVVLLHSKCDLNHWLSRSEPLLARQSTG